MKYNEHHASHNEMEHHKMREHHKAAHHAKKVDNHAKHPKMHEHGMNKSHHSMMIDNRHVNENHQQGIERVKQRHGDMEVGHHGKMGMGHHQMDSFKRSGGKMTPSKG